MRAPAHMSAPAPACMRTPARTKEEERSDPDNIVRETVM